MQQPSVPATQPFTVTLEAQQWNAVLGALADAPFRIAAPLVQAISDQLQGQAQQSQPVPNGPSIAMPPPH
jgi:hypothetical protein